MGIGHWEAIVCWSHHMLKAQFPMPKLTFIRSAIILYRGTPRFVKTEWKKWLNSLHTSALASVDIQSPSCSNVDSAIFWIILLLIRWIALSRFWTTGSNELSYFISYLWCMDTMEFCINEWRVSFWRKEVFANFPHRCSALFSSVRHVERVTKAQERLCNRLNICLLCLFPFNVISRAIPVGLAWPWGADRPYSKNPQLRT